MSSQARHLFALKQGVHDLRARPSITLGYHEALDHMQWRVRAWAEYLIAWGCQP